jgi:hypothetical protein
VVGLDARLKALETDVLKVRAEAMSTRVEVAGVEFVSPISVEEWVAQNQVVQGPMMFLDVVSLLQLAYAAGQGDQQATQRVTRVIRPGHSRSRSKLSTCALVDVRNSDADRLKLLTSTFSFHNAKTKRLVLFIKSTGI